MTPRERDLAALGGMLPSRAPAAITAARPRRRSRPPDDIMAAADGMRA